MGHCTSGLEPSWTNLNTPGGPGSPTTPQNSHFLQKLTQLTILRSSLVKDEMVWKQCFSVILMYIFGWRSGTFAAHSPMIILKIIENSQNGHFVFFWLTPPTLRFISEKFFKYKKCSYCTEWWSYIIRSPPGGFGGQLNFHPIPPLTAHCVLVWGVGVSMSSSCDGASPSHHCHIPGHLFMTCLCCCSGGKAQACRFSQ